ncbi:hypothetical protein BUE80_DR002978 [Diplocarpon rosae]|nr:hypothetical protein BUE80_DR002978 [Diplocarpon rosae]
MGVIRTLLSTAALGGAGSGAAFAYSNKWTRNSKFVPLSPSDAIFSSSAYSFQNPNRNPATQDLCVRRVPLTKIKPQLLEKEGKLVEAFCAGVWGGYGRLFSRLGWGDGVTFWSDGLERAPGCGAGSWPPEIRQYLEKKYRNSTTAHQLWDRSALLASTYEPGTEITDHFEVVSKTPTSIVVRCGGSPLVKTVRDSDGLFEMGVEMKREEGVAEFRLKSVFFQGAGTTGTKPMPPHVEFLHRLYTKVWMETALGNVTL